MAEIDQSLQAKVRAWHNQAGGQAERLDDRHALRRPRARLRCGAGARLDDGMTGDDAMALAGY